MISTRNVAFLIIGAVLLAPPLIRAQDAKPSETGLNLQLSFIQELPLQLQRFPGFAPTGAVAATPALAKTQDLSKYREFQFGMNLPAVAKETGMKLSEARTLHARPAVIQELEWRPQFSHGGPLLGTDPVEDVLFSFYEGQLFRIVVNYNRERTKGLTNEEMIEAISATYGTATRPATKTIQFSSSQVYNDSEKVLACWEDGQYSFNLFHSPYGSAFGMMAYSKWLDAQARTAVAEAIRLDAQEAPLREVELQKKQEADNRAEQEKARLANKPNFRP
jgi:hypothetical protein